MKINDLVKELIKVQSDLGNIDVWYVDLSTGGYKVINHIEVKNFVALGTQKILVLV